MKEIKEPYYKAREIYYKQRSIMCEIVFQCRMAICPMWENNKIEEMTLKVLDEIISAIKDLEDLEYWGKVKEEVYLINKKAKRNPD